MGSRAQKGHLALETFLSPILFFSIGGVAGHRPSSHPGAELVGLASHRRPPPPRQPGEGLADTRKLADGETFHKKTQKEP